MSVNKIITTESNFKRLSSEDGKNLFWTTDINVELPIKLSRDDSTPLKINDTFNNACDK